MLTTLDVFNDCIATKGEAPIDTQAEAILHPDYATAIRRLRVQSRLVQARGWWFNTVWFDATPGAAPNYAVDFPCGVLKIDGPYGRALVIRGTGIYDYTNQEMLSTPVTGIKATVELAFEDLPPVAQTHIAERAVLSFQKDYDGDQRRSQELRGDKLESYYLLNAEHTRSVKANFLTRASTANRIAAAAGYLGGVSNRLPVR